MIKPNLNGWIWGIHVWTNHDKPLYIIHYNFNSSSTEVHSICIHVQYVWSYLYMSGSLNSRPPAVTVDLRKDDSLVLATNRSGFFASRFTDSEPTSHATYPYYPSRLRFAPTLRQPARRSFPASCMPWKANWIKEAEAFGDTVWLWQTGMVQK